MEKSTIALKFGAVRKRFDATRQVEFDEQSPVRRAFRLATIYSQFVGSLDSDRVSCSECVTKPPGAQSICRLGAESRQQRQAALSRYRRRHRGRHSQRAACRRPIACRRNASSRAASTIDFTTVARGYVEAQKRGLIESHVGRGTFVRSSARRRHGADGAPSGDRRSVDEPAARARRSGTARPHAGRPRSRRPRSRLAAALPGFRRRAGRQGRGARTG